MHRAQHYGSCSGVSWRGEGRGKEEKEPGGEEEREKPVTCQAQLLHPAMGEWGWK